MYMILNLSSSGTDVTAEGIKYGESNVGQALSVLEDEFTANGQRIYLDYKDGQYGYNTDALRGADTFSPFKSGGSSANNPYTNLTTATSVSGTDLPTIEGKGYLILRRTGGADGNDKLLVYIDGNAMGFPAVSSHTGNTIGGYYKFYFQKKIQIAAGTSMHTYLYQTLLTDEELEDKYIITTGGTTNGVYTEITGRGKILVSCGDGTAKMHYNIDNVTESRFDFYGEQYMEFNFSKMFRFMTENDDRIYYIAYVEK